MRTLFHWLKAGIVALIMGGVLAGPVAAQPAKRPNILVIMPDDVGMTNVGAYSHGMMVPTPNIDRIAREGMLFTDHYSHPSCTPGRAAFLTGQLPIRTGLTTVGLPGSPVGLDARDPTLAEVLKTQGYRTGQFGKNHLGDRNSHLPTVHGFDEFFGNLYHLNTEEEPELPEWPKTPGFDQRYRPRGVLDCVATAVADAADDGRFGPMGKQRCKDTGPLTRKRMETVDEEFGARTQDFIRRAVKDGQPFFAWHNPSRMHVYTHLKPASRFLAAPYSSSLDIYGSGMMEHDGHVGELLRLLDELKVADNTLVIYTTDNGPMVSWWPDAGATPFRSEKATTWEGGVRVPMLIRWPAKIAAGKVSNGIQTHEDLFTTLAAAGGAGDVAARLRDLRKVHIDGVDNLEHWIGNAPSKRNVVYYYNESALTAIRIGPWKSHLQVRDGFFDYLKPSSKVFNLRMDPFERHDGQKADELAMLLGVAWGGQVYDAIGAHMATFKQFPPRQAGGSLSATTK
ncbi:MAG: arylsulfatase [Comamonadaceae bacterium]|jgi:arylsulfatase A-like enzyme|uniref:arylsulfatase n=1 Tax=Candidatus Skiveiella danica TaxID=3386177 RepID=UPI001DAF0C80|nr:arylsulfatase [Comamonadaceae bacterium]MBK7990638.1 arylsulfatase [Comamonadaceae bacterium]MBK8361602.1 arylsulfatase [Comamonadaceae bacterium]MBK9198985.1 arylsulfatase [Betaproteobacteria bacterium]MBK9986089.1 arylsulfatase [Betaproteobacteria bacterium]